MGIEALSRGAKTATFIDKDFISIKFIKENIHKLSLETQTTIIQKDALLAIKKLKGTIFDIISIDPPFIVYKKNPEYINTLLNEITCLCHKNTKIFLEEPIWSERTHLVDKLVLKEKRKYSSGYLLELLCKF